MSLSIKFGNFLFRHFFSIYKPLYFQFKKKQDAFEISLIQKFVRKGDIVLDIGANIGFYARLISDLVGEKGKVHCFEPDLKNFEHLKKEATGLKNVQLNQKAVSNSSGVLRFYTSPKLNVDHRTYEPEYYESVTEVNAVSIDDYLKQEDHVVNFIKMDIQGFEWQALQGMKLVLQKNPDVKMISEFWPYGLKKSGASLLVYYQALQAIGFHCYLMEGVSLNLLTEEKVKSLQDLGEAHYFNILASRNHVH